MVLADQVVSTEEASAFFTNCIQSNPADDFAYYMRAVIRHDFTHDLEGALSDYNETIRVAPTKPFGYCSRGLLWCDQKDYDKAIADYTEAIHLDPQYVAAYANRADAWCTQKQYDRAVTDYDYVIRLDPDRPFAYAYRADAWYGKKEYGKAIADYNEAVRRDPKNADAYDGRAWLWATCPAAQYRDGKKAIESATTACELTEWTKANPLGTLAAAYAEAGDFASAVRWQTNADALNSDPESKKKGEERLKLYLDNTPYRVP